MGADVDEIRRHGRWSGDRLTQAYLSPISHVSVRVLAGFPRERGSFFLERGTLEPPASLESQVFPEVDEWTSKLNAAPQLFQATATVGFLNLMRYLRKVILQDSVLLMEEFPTAPIWQHRLFQSDEYRSFLRRSKDALATVESPFDLQLQAVLPQVHQGLQNLQNTVVSSNRQVTQSIQQAMQDMEHRLQSSEIDSHRLAAIFRSVTNCSEEISRVLEVPEQDLPSQPSASSATPVMSALGSLPRYQMSRTISSVRELWQEWEIGLQGQPSVRDLESRYHAKWRSSAAERKFFQRRRRILAYIEDQLHEREALHGEEGRRSEVVVAALDERCAREGLTLNQLSDKIGRNDF